MKLTKELIEARIEGVEYQTVEIHGKKMMFCGIKMPGGFVVVGEPAMCIDPANWSYDIGQQVSYEHSFQKLWELEAYRIMSEVA